MVHARDQLLKFLFLSVEDGQYPNKHAVDYKKARHITFVPEKIRQNGFGPEKRLLVNEPTVG